LDFSPRQISEQVEFLNRKTASQQELKNDFLDSKLDKKIWNHYDDDKEAFYIKCYELIDKMSRKETDELLGELGKKLEQDFLKAGAIWKD
jgi:hypothetical protein